MDLNLKNDTDPKTKCTQDDVYTQLFSENPQKRKRWKRKNQSLFSQFHSGIKCYIHKPFYPLPPNSNVPTYIDTHICAWECIVLSSYDTGKRKKKSLHMILLPRCKSNLIWRDAYSSPVSAWLRSLGWWRAWNSLESGSRGQTGNCPC